MSTVDGGHCHSHCRHPCRHCPADSVRVAGRRAHVIALRCSVVPGEAEQRIAPLEVAPVGARSVAPAAVARSVAPAAVAQSAASLAAATPSRAGAGLDAANRSDLRFGARTRATDCQIEQAELGVSDRPSASRLRPAVALMVAALRAQSVAQVPAVSMGARNAGAPNYCGSLADWDLSSSDPMVEASRSRDSARRHFPAGSRAPRSPRCCKCTCRSPPAGPVTRWDTRSAASPSPTGCGRRTASRLRSAPSSTRA